MRTNFYELLAKRDFVIWKEYETLWNLFAEECSVPSSGYFVTLISYINTAYFRKLPFRGSFTSINEMMSDIGIRSDSNEIEDLLLFCEFLIAVLPEDMVGRDRCLKNQSETILKNIAYILERTNHELKSDQYGHYIIVEKNKQATLAAQLVDDSCVAFELIEYNHFAIKGHLDEKRKLLASIANYIEPILKSKVLQKGGYQSLQSDAGFVFNNFHIRHNNKEGAKKQDYIASLDNSELEEWYDKAYEIALSVIIISDYLTIGSEIADLKTKYTWRT